MDRWPAPAPARVLDVGGASERHAAWPHRVASAYGWWPGPQARGPGQDPVVWAPLWEALVSCLATTRGRRHFAARGRSAPIHYHPSHEDRERALAEAVCGGVVGC